MNRFCSFFLHLLQSCEHASKTHEVFKKNIAYLGRQVFFLFFYIKMSIKHKIFILKKPILRAFVDTRAHIPNMRRATFYHNYVVYFVCSLGLWCI